MCGIAGSFGRVKPDERAIRSCLDSMVHRGPDAEGVYQTDFNGQVLCLLHTRLSIIDLDPRANQPFEHDDCVLVHNGEIYNYVELRQELEEMGCTFRTESDTEVLGRRLISS